jgi:DNA-binding CsgD family transcriptional regulator
LKQKRSMTLTRRQHQIFTLLESGYTTRDIAEYLNVSERAVIYHITQVRRRFGASSRAQIIALLVQIRTEQKSEDPD